MAKCCICERPVVSKPQVLATGELVHNECRAVAFWPRQRAKVVGPRKGTITIGATPPKQPGDFDPQRPNVVLFVAAEEGALFTYRVLASAAKIQAELARDPYEAFLLAQLVRPDALVVDFRTDRLDGPWVLDRLMAPAALGSAPILLVGGRSTEGPSGGRARVYALPAIEPSEVLRAVEHALNECRRSRTVR